MDLRNIAQLSAGILESVGIAVIIVIGIYSTVSALYSFLKDQYNDDTFVLYRHRFGRGILLGLEFLVGADIIHTVAVDLSYKSIGVLAIIVIIRTFLSFTLELEISGKWPGNIEEIYLSTNEHGYLSTNDTNRHKYLFSFVCVCGRNFLFVNK
jgi:uncharacterized membrane protein